MSVNSFEIPVLDKKDLLKIKRSEDGERVINLYEDLLAIGRELPGSGKFYKCIDNIEKALNKLFKSKNMYGEGSKKNSIRYNKDQKFRSAVNNHLLSAIIGTDIDIEQLKLGVSQKLFVVLSSSTELEVALLKLGVVYKIFQGQILPGDSDHKQDTNSESSIFWTRSLEFLMRLFAEHKVYTDDIFVILSSNPANKYIGIFIPILNKTIFISNNNDGACIMLNGRIEEKDYLNKSADEMHSMFNGIRLTTKDQDLDEWEHYLFEREDLLREKINISLYLDIIEAIKKEYTTLKSFLEIPKIERRNVRVKGISLSQIAYDIFMFRGLNLYDHNPSFELFAREIYGEFNEDDIAAKAQVKAPNNIKRYN